MCGIACLVGPGWEQRQLEAMVETLHQRGPDDRRFFVDPEGSLGFGHTRLSILDLSPAGRQPMATPDGRLRIVFNGEVYNYLELRAELAGDYEFVTGTDTEVLLAAYRRWGEHCLDRLIGMFALMIWDAAERTLFAARDRFGVKPLYWCEDFGGCLLLASEIKALHAAGVMREPDPQAWATYLAHGLQDHSPRTFWRGVRALPPGCCLTWKDGRAQIRRWYDLAEGVGRELDRRPEAEVREEYRELLAESVRLRFRSDVPIGINLSGGLDSSVLLGLVQEIRGRDSDLQVYTFTCGDPRYDELPWVRRMLASTRHPLTVCRLEPGEVPGLAAAVQASEDEPFGGLPTLAYANIFLQARSDGVIVLLDGQGMDEQWAGYDYYTRALEPAPDGRTAEVDASLIQGTCESPVRPQCLTSELLALAEPLATSCRFPDRLRNLQLRDACVTKIPRALRFNDRISMRASTELREPFLDHRLVELALRQPPERKIRHGVRKRLLREIAAALAPGNVVEAPKRPLQTPQREWLRRQLRGWAEAMIETALDRHGGAWLETAAVRRHWLRYLAGGSDNSFYVWQWISLGMMSQDAGVAAAACGGDGPRKRTTVTDAAGDREP